MAAPDPIRAELISIARLETDYYDPDPGRLVDSLYQRIEADVLERFGVGSMEERKYEFRQRIAQEVEQLGHHPDCDAYASLHEGSEGDPRGVATGLPCSCGIDDAARIVRGDV